MAAVGATTTTTSAATTTTAQSGQDAALAFSRCMRAHGVSKFPDPEGQGRFPALTQQALGVSKQTSLVAQQACKHLLSSGDSTGTPQARQQKVAFALKVAKCMRMHGFPTYPDPTSSSQALPSGIDPNSPQFQTTETACEQQARKELGLP